MSLNDDQVERYARHLILREVGGAGQARLINSRVLIVGAGGLGSTALLYLTAAGVGTIGVVDHDVVSLSNLQRQVAHRTADLGRAKVESAAATARAINPHVNIEVHQTRLEAYNAFELLRQYDVVLDGSDSFATRFLVNDACFLLGKILISAAVGQFDGQLAVYKAHILKDGQRAFPCYRCLVPDLPPSGFGATCSEAGVIGALTGVMGSMQALETIKEILEIGDTMAGRLMLYDALSGVVRTVKVTPDRDCQLCGQKATLTDLSHHGVAPSSCSA